MFTSLKSFRKIEAIQERELRFVISNYESTYEDLLNKTVKPNMSPRKARSLCIEIYETLNNLSLEFMKDLLRLHATKRVQREKYKSNLETPNSN